MKLRRSITGWWWNRRRIAGDVMFIVQHVARGVRLAGFQTLGDSHFRVRGATRADIITLDKLYRMLPHGEGLESRFTWLLRLSGRRYCLIAEDSGGRIAGFTLYYFNARDGADGTIHEGFIGVDSDYRGRGVSSLLRHEAVRHFKATGLKGMSTRISVSNDASMSLALRLGFQVVERYFDPAWREDRAYLVLRFSAQPRQ